MFDTEKFSAVIPEGELTKKFRRHLKESKLVEKARVSGQIPLL